MVARVFLISTLILGPAAVGVAVDTAAMEAAVRQALETELRKATGSGYSSFGCEIGEDIAPGGRFECHAVTEDGGSEIEYLIGIDEDGGAKVILTSEPADQLSAEDRKILEPPCLKFIEDYNAGSWEALYAPFHEALKEAVSFEDARQMLAPVRSDLGPIRKATLTTHGIHESGRHELAYDLECERGHGAARFGVLAGDDGASLVAFVITAAAGSAAQARMLERTGRDLLGGLIGAPVVRIEAPLEQLREVGDAVEGTAWTEDGRDFPIRAEQHGRRDDFDSMDYRFQVLDAPWLLRRMLEGRSQQVESVECPERAPEDGKVMSCLAITGNGKLVLTVQRTGGNYRLVESAPSGGE
jgi:hypothetical protein